MTAVHAMFFHILFLLRSLRGRLLFYLLSLLRLADILLLLRVSREDICREKAFVARSALAAWKATFGSLPISLWFSNLTGVLRQLPMPTPCGAAPCRSGVGGPRTLPAAACAGRHYRCGGAPPLTDLYSLLSTRPFARHRAWRDGRCLPLPLLFTYLHTCLPAPRCQQHRYLPFAVSGHYVPLTRFVGRRMIILYRLVRNPRRASTAYRGTQDGTLPCTSPPLDKHGRFETNAPRPSCLP